VDHFEDQFLADTLRPWALILRNEAKFLRSRGADEADFLHPARWRNPFTRTTPSAVTFVRWAPFRSSRARARSIWHAAWSGGKLRMQKAISAPPWWQHVVASSRSVKKATIEVESVAIWGTWRKAPPPISRSGLTRPNGSPMWSPSTRVQQLQDRVESTPASNRSPQRLCAKLDRAKWRPPWRFAAFRSGSSNGRSSPAKSIALWMNINHLDSEIRSSKPGTTPCSQVRARELKRELRKREAMAAPPCPS